MLMRQPVSHVQFAYQPPFGPTLHENGVQFSVFSRSATAMRLLLYNKVSDREPAEVVEFDPLAGQRTVGTGAGTSF